jgi:transcriptional regulator
MSINTCDTPNNNVYNIDNMSKESADLLQGTLDLLILKNLSLEPMNGWAMSKRIERVSDETLLVKQGSLYPCLHRLEEKGLVKAKWGTSENNRRAKFYSLTQRGRKQFERETASWKRFSGSVELVLQMS